MTYRIGIIGAGVMGRKRAEVLRDFPKCRLVATADIDRRKGEELARTYGGQVETDWKDLVRDPSIDIIIVSTSHKFLAPISLAAVKNHKHVLCEKPLGQTVHECRNLVKTSASNKVVLKTGFNLRFHPALIKAKQLSDGGGIGGLFFLRCRYGHGGRSGYEREWRLNKDMAGGGELLDQGIHVADLFRWFAGDFQTAFGMISSCHWAKTVEDNAFGMFRNRNGVAAVFHVSWTQWKSLFSFEVFGRDGYLIVDGLGGNYGRETLRYGKRKPASAIPEEKQFVFSGKDDSLKHEWRDFVSAIEQNREPQGSGRDGYQANRMVHAVYSASRKGKLIRL